MNDKIFIEVGKQLGLEEYVHVAAKTASLIADAAENINEISRVFFIDDLLILLNKVCVHMPGEFEIRRFPSCYCQIIYNRDIFNAVAFEETDIPSDFVEMDDNGQNRIWISDKVVYAFIDRKLYGAATVIYFYLGYLMTQDETFGLSHNISFEKILESCDQLPKDFPVKHPTTLMRALADLQDAGLVKWNAQSRTFELLHITPYDPNEKV